MQLGDTNILKPSNSSAYPSFLNLFIFNLQWRKRHRIFVLFTNEESGDHIEDIQVGS